MRRQDFSYELPPELIAHFPAANRRDSRLLCLDGPSGDIEDSQFATLLERLEPGDLLVLNDTRVIPARLFGKKQSGGQVEVLVERMLGKSEVMAHVRASKSPKPGTYIVLEDGSQLEVLAREGALFHLRLEGEGSVLDTLNTLGHMPLPPYIEREDELDDRERYQTVYGKHPGAVAAPTAGLHFDQEFLQALTDRGVKLAYVTLHVGAGTFQPVRVDDIKEHAMHSEWAVVSPEVCELVQATKAAGRRVVAVGTTSVRSLESAAAAGEIQAFSSDTNIFIYPGYQFKVVDALVTNFHLPESTLMMLVSAFAGYRHVMAAYEHAVAQRYRFFSYGDAMFISCNPSAAEQMPGGEA